MAHARHASELTTSCRDHSVELHYCFKKNYLERLDLRENVWAGSNSHSSKTRRMWCFFYLTLECFLFVFCIHLLNTDIHGNINSAHLLNVWRASLANSANYNTMLSRKSPHPIVFIYHTIYTYIILTHMGRGGGEIGLSYHSNYEVWWLFISVHTYQQFPVVVEELRDMETISVFFV